MKSKNKIILLISLLIFVLLLFGLYYIIYLDIAHSSFENYYKFRGCTELINKTSDYGICKTGSGETIKIVKYDDKWYLDGDLPVSCGIINCP